MITVFWDCEGIILIDYLPQGRTINADYYSDLLKGPLHEALKKKRCRKLHLRPLLQQDNARPHTARRTIDVIAELKWELLPHPPYSPDLAPSDYHLFGELKKPLRGIHFDSLKAVQKAVNNWVSSTPEKFFENGLKKLIKHWYKCIELKGDYVEKFDIEIND
jgi:histone-lysine N-methyltransferase SETMAR